MSKINITIPKHIKNASLLYYNYKAWGVGSFNEIMAYILNIIDLI